MKSFVQNCPGVDRSQQCDQEGLFTGCCTESDGFSETAALCFDGCMYTTDSFSVTRSTLSYVSTTSLSAIWSITHTLENGGDGVDLTYSTVELDGCEASYNGVDCTICELRPCSTIASETFEVKQPYIDCTGLVGGVGSSIIDGCSMPSELEDSSLFEVLY